MYNNNTAPNGSLGSYAAVERHILRIVSGNSTFHGVSFYLHSYVERPMAYQ